MQGEQVLVASVLDKGLNSFPASCKYFGGKPYGPESTEALSQQLQAVLTLEFQGLNPSFKP